LEWGAIYARRRRRRIMVRYVPQEDRSRRERKTGRGKCHKKGRRGVTGANYARLSTVQCKLNRDPNIGVE